MEAAPPVAFGTEELPYGAPPLSPEETSALIAAQSCKTDWGPVFIYGSMLFPSAWGALIERLPAMRCATLRGYERRAFHTGGFAGVYPSEGKSVCGQLVSGLLPMERAMLDAVVDDSFLLENATVEPTGDSEPRIAVTQCGDADFNGRYVPDGTKEGRPCYKKDGPDSKGQFKTIHFESGCWHFCTDYLGFFYVNAYDGIKPPEDGWRIDADGLTPLPKLSKEPMAIECTTYVLRESCMDAMTEHDWDFEAFGEHFIDGFVQLCVDTRVRMRADKLPDATLRELAMARRRNETGFDGADIPEEVYNPDDPDAIDPRLGVKFPRGIIRLDGIFAEQHLRSEDWLQMAGPDATSGRTPEEEMQWLEENEKAGLAARRRTKGPKYPQEVNHREAGTLLQKLREGDIQLFGEELPDLAASGLPPTKGADFAVVSAPISTFTWFARACIACATFRVGWAEVSARHFEEVWFFVWKRNIEKAVQANKSLIVLTKPEKYGGPVDKVGNGSLEFLQSVQALYLRQKGYKFFVVDCMEFCSVLQPVLDAAMCNNFDEVEQTLMNRRDSHVPLNNVRDNTGRGVMHYVARFGATERVLRMLLEGGEDVDSVQWCCDEYGSGWTPLMTAAKYGPSRMVKLFCEAGADYHAKNAAGQTVFQLVRGRADNERMLSQCYYKSCKKKGQEDSEAARQGGVN